jgi:hypothetical protein
MALFHLRFHPQELQVKSPSVEVLGVLNHKAHIPMLLDGAFLEALAVEVVLLLLDLPRLLDEVRH